MDYFEYRDGDLFAEDVPVARIAEQHGTPAYIYSRATLERHYRAYTAAAERHPHLICFAVKSNSNIAVLNLLARMGSGFDIVSGGELERVIAAGGDPGRTVFSGVGKTTAEIRRALEAGIRCINIESAAELERVQQVAAEMEVNAPVSLRVNPDVDANTHPYIATGLKENKFGIDFKDAAEVYRRAASLANIRVTGIDCHIGSQLTELQPFLDAVDRVLELIDQLARDGIPLQHLDIGGGLGVRYHDEQPPEPSEYVAAIVRRLGKRKLELLMEPGRSITANAGILVSRVEYIKHTRSRNFAIIDAGMNDLLRPALYEAWQEIIPVDAKGGEEQRAVYDIVGPVCETADFLGRSRLLTVSQGDLLAIRSAGAYGFSMSSNYNSRNRPPEIMVDGDQVHVVRARETVADQMRGEQMLPQ